MCRFHLVETTQVESNLAVAEIDASSVIIPVQVADGMDGWKCKMVKEATADIRTNSIIMGKCIVSTSQSLHRLKSLIPRSNWIAFLDSGMIPIKRATALNLVKAWDIFLSKGMLSDGELANISAQSLGKIARANDPDVIKKVTAKLKAGEKVTEKETDSMLNEAKQLAEGLNESNSGTTVASLMSLVESSVIKNNRFMSSEERLKAKITKLEEQVLSLEKENKELKAQMGSPVAS